ncbi:MAG: hypothetical protein MZW92_48340 [Comamonadaceae bacterium]|nr:hypothetical protein [Comamonadaceae bacterium]
MHSRSLNPRTRSRRRCPAYLPRLPGATPSTLPRPGEGRHHRRRRRLRRQRSWRERTGQPGRASASSSSTSGPTSAATPTTAYDDAGVLVHSYGPHIFHTNSSEVFDYLSRFTAWRPYRHTRARERPTRAPARLPDADQPATPSTRLYGLHARRCRRRRDFLERVREPCEPVRSIRGRRA